MPKFNVKKGLLIYAGLLLASCLMLEFSYLINERPQEEACSQFWNEPCTMMAIPDSIREGFTKEYYDSYKILKPDAAK